MHLYSSEFPNGFIILWTVFLIVRSLDTASCKIELNCSQYVYVRIAREYWENGREGERGREQSGSRVDPVSLISVCSLRCFDVEHYVKCSCWCDIWFSAICKQFLVFPFSSCASLCAYWIKFYYISIRAIECVSNILKIKKLARVWFSCDFPINFIISIFLCIKNHLLNFIV